jgi:Na+/proline symporter
MDHLKLARIVTLVLGAAGIATGFLMATLDIVSLWDQFQLILGLILGGIGGLFFLGMLTKRANGPGAIIGLAGSTLFQVWVYQNEIVHLLIFTATGFISCFVIGYLASLLFRSEQKEITHLTIYGIWQKKMMIKAVDKT